MPSCPAHLCGVRSLGGGPVPPDTPLTPYLRVLPMGWSWALHLCQRVMESIVESVVGPSRVLRDRDDSLTIGPAPAHVANLKPDFSETDCFNSCELACAVYVDNVAVISHSVALAERGSCLIVSALRQVGLTVHEITAASSSAEFIGLQI